MGILILPGKDDPLSILRRENEAAKERDGDLDQVKKGERRHRCICVAHPPDVTRYFIDAAGSPPVCPTCRNMVQVEHKAGTLKDTIGKAFHKNATANTTHEHPLEELGRA